jgi:hypothetical protein
VLEAGLTFAQNVARASFCVESTKEKITGII